MPRMLGAVTAVSLVCLPTAATALVIDFGGIVNLALGEQFDDSVVEDMRVTGRYEVDPAHSGGPFGQVGAATLTFAVGNYQFDETQNAHVLSLINDRVTVPPATVDIWQSGRFGVDQLEPAIPRHPGGVGFVFGIEFFDFDSENITGREPAPFVVTELSDWSSGRVFVSELIGTEASVQLEIALDTWQVVPEPASGALVGFGLLALALRRPISSRDSRRGRARASSASSRAA